MSNVPLEQRKYHCFLSYASEDLAAARMLADWLEAAGLTVFLDKNWLSAGAPVLGELTTQICNSRGCVVLLTKSALEKNYVKHEVEIAIEQQVTEPGFVVIAVSTDPSLDPTQRFPALRKVSWMTMAGGQLDLESARRLLLSVTPAARLAPDDRHIYVSLGWGDGEQALNRRLCKFLASRGVRLVGDEKHARFGEEGKTRVRRIMSGCRGHLMILPQRRSTTNPPEETYKHFLAEWEISRQLWLARRIFCVSRAALPQQLQQDAIEVGANGDAMAVEPELLNLSDETDPAAPYLFLAVDFKVTQGRNEAARDVLQHVLGMECFLGKDYLGDQLRQAIVEKIANANTVIADLACVKDEPANRLRPNLNTCIEAGIAAGARVPLFATALDPETFEPGVRDKTAQIPFMFRNSQIHWYKDATDYLAKIHRLAYATRRRIISDEPGCA